MPNNRANMRNYGSLGGPNVVVGGYGTWADIWHVDAKGRPYNVRETQGGAENVRRSIRPVVGEQMANKLVSKAQTAGAQYWPNPRGPGYWDIQDGKGRFPSQKKKPK